MSTTNKNSIKQVFSELNRKFEEEETGRQAEQIGLPYFNLSGFPIDDQAMAVFSEEEARIMQAIPFYKEGTLVKIGLTDPTNQALKTALDQLTKRKLRIEPYLVSSSGLAEAFQQYKRIISAPPILKQGVSIGLGVDQIEKLKSLAQDKDNSLATSASSLIALLVGSAVTMHSSDIHIEPGKSGIKIRFRIDGVLHDITTLPFSILHLLLSRLKLLAGLKLNVTTTPQDGRFTVTMTERVLDLRISLLPSSYGESVVLRILGIQDIGLDMEKIGLAPVILQNLHKQIAKPNGMILTTGPTGSGKTTTLYSFLNYLNQPDMKIITLEDPIEYQLEGITQTPIDKNSGLDFAKGLRAVMRQDPDIIMVGEILDFETAEIAFQSALTGHLVFSTLHTNDAAGAIPRLLDIGVKAVTLAPALNVIIAQRLLRKICQSCKVIYKPDVTESAQLQAVLSTIPKQSGIIIPEVLTFYHSPGCHECHGLGYKGRTGIYEVLIISEALRKLIYEASTSMVIKQQAILDGMLTMQQDAIVKAISGITDLPEVWRVTEE